MRIILRYGFLLLLMLVSSVSFSQQDIKFTHLLLKDGLSQSSVNCIFQDSKGFMWFGTHDGLNKYDGYSFTIYRKDPGDVHSLSDNKINAIYEDKSGMLWIGTDGGLNRLDPKTQEFTSWLHDPKDKHSISNDIVNAVIEDKNGVIWIGTHGGGLNRFDRETKKFTHYKHNPDDEHSISDNRIHRILEDSYGVLWIGTAGGLNKLIPPASKVVGGVTNGNTPPTFIHYKHDPRDENTLIDNLVNSLCEDSQGALWVVTDGLQKFDRKTEKFIRYGNHPQDGPFLSINGATSICEDKNGSLWIGTWGNGVIKFNPNTLDFTRFTHDPLDKYSLSPNVVFSIFEDKGGVIWISTDGWGVNKYEPTSKKFIHYKNDPNDDNTLSMNYVYSIIEDKQGVLWIGGEAGKLDKFDRATGKFTHFNHDLQVPNSHPDGMTWAMLEDRHGTLWIGTWNGGLSKFNRTTGKYTHYRHEPQNEHSISNNTVLKIYEDKNGVLWIGTEGGGLNKFLQGKTEKSPPVFIHYRHDPYDEYSISDGRIWLIFEDSYGAFWIGTDNGILNKLDRETGKFTHYKYDPQDEHSISNNSRVLSMYEDKHGALWIGTHGGGLNKFDRNTEKFTHWNTKDGLPNDIVYGILADDHGCLWLSTNKGVSRFNPPSVSDKYEKLLLEGDVSPRLGRGEFKNYDVSDGIQSNEFNTGAYFKNKDGEMFFGGVNGFNAFYPDKVTDNPYVPDLVISGFQIFNKEVPVLNKSLLTDADMRIGTDDANGNEGQGTMSKKVVSINQEPETSNALITIGDRFYLPKHINYTDTIILSWKESVFSFEFTALQYVNPGKNQYAYMMEGFDRENSGWNYVGKRRNATYTNLDPGEYVFKVKQIMTGSGRRKV